MLRITGPGGTSPEPMNKAESTYWYNHAPSSPNFGSYDYKVYVEENSSEDNTSEISLTLDGGSPSYGINIGSRINSDSAESFEVEASDTETSVSSIEVVLENSDDEEIWDDTKTNCDSQECTFSTDFSDELSHGNSYSLDITVEDAAGNTYNPSDEEFYYDNEYEGDSDPEVYPQPRVFRGSGPGEINVTLEGREQEDSDVSIACQGSIVDDERSGSVSLSDGEMHEFTCGYNQMDGFNVDRVLDLKIKMFDEAGNSDTADIGKYFFDHNPPVLGNLSAVVGVFNSDFQVSYDAYDSQGIEGLEVSKINYQIDDSSYDLQTGTNISEINEDFKVNTSGLSKGEHTVYAWAVDKAGRPSERRAFEFNFKPDAEPEVALGSVDSVSVTAGNSETVSVNVTNTGELFVGSMDLSLNSDVRNSSRTLNDLKPGEMENGLFSVDTSSDDLGVHQLKFSTESPDSSRTVRFVVEANKDQEERIESDYSEYISKYNELQENVTQLKNSGLSDSRKETLDSNTSEFFSDMESAKRAKESGDLYLVEKHMMDISADFQTASTTFEEVQKQHQRSERNQTFMMVFLLFIGLGGSGLAYIAFFSEQYELSMEALQDIDALEGPVQTVQTTLDQYELSLEPLENAVERVGELLAEEEKEIEEAEEQAFQGFT